MADDDDDGDLATFVFVGSAGVHALQLVIMSWWWSWHQHWDSHDDCNRGAWRSAGSSSDAWWASLTPGDNNRSGG